MGWYCTGMTWDDMGWQQAVCHTLSMHFAWKLPPSQYGMTQDDTGPCALQKTWNLVYGFPGMSWDDTGWHLTPFKSIWDAKPSIFLWYSTGMTWDDSRKCPRMTWDDTGWDLTYFMLQNLLFCFDIAQGWHGMTAGCLPHLKHEFCIESASKSIWDDTGWHWPCDLQKKWKLGYGLPRMTWDDTACH
jgi:hypothetical protein